MKLDYKWLGKRIAARRKELGYRQSYVEEKADLSDKYLSNIETGRSIPSLETLVRLCEALDVTPDYLLLGAIKSSAHNPEDELFRQLQLMNRQEQALLLHFIEWMKEEGI